MDDRRMHFLKKQARYFAKTKIINIDYIRINSDNHLIIN
jgi:hypothetical protein